MPNANDYLALASTWRKEAEEWDAKRDPNEQCDSPADTLIECANELEALTNA